MPESPEPSTTSQHPPQPESPQPSAQVDDPSVTFTWRGPDEATNYELQIARDASFDQLLFEGRVGDEETFTFNGLPAQEGITIHWRVRALVDDAWTDFGPASDFTVIDWRADPVPFEENEPVSGRAPVTEGTQSRSGPILVMFTIAISIGTIALAAYYFQGSGLETADDATAEPDTTVEEVDLNAYGIVDEEAGVYRIPIDQAINLVVRERRGSVDTTMQQLSIPQPTANPPNGSGSQE